MKKANALLSRFLGVFNIESIVEIPIEKIMVVDGHPFKVVDDVKMAELVETISRDGILEPVIVRPCTEGYEMVSGHRRLYASKKLGRKTIPAIVRELTDDESAIVMVAANVQRGEWLPSEKAFAYKRLMDAIRHQGERRDLTCGQSDHKLKGIKARDIIAENFDISAKSVQRYVRLTKLIPGILDLVDKRKLKIVQAEMLAGFGNNVQEVVLEYIRENKTISKAQLERLRDNSATDRYEILKVLEIDQMNYKVHNNIELNKDKLNKYFPLDYADDEREKIIWSLLGQWSKRNS